MKQFCKRKHDTFVVGRDSYKVCKECRREHSHKWGKENPEKLQESVYKCKKKNLKKHRETARKAAWKIQGIRNLDGSVFTIEDYKRFYKSQQGKCSICRTPQSKLKSSLAVDHNHQTGAVRGLLCYRCNVRLGILEDKGFNQKAHEYFNKNQQCVS
jgi:hypothetical protein